jgi:mediator of RNA polymerase II transcription subunit 25
MSNQLQSQQQVSQLEVQAQSNPGQDVLAVACVIDASLALATEWTRVFTAYILPILKRLNEAYIGHSVRFTCIILLSSSMLSMGDVFSSD